MQAIENIMNYLLVECHKLHTSLTEYDLFVLCKSISIKVDNTKKRNKNQYKVDIRTNKKWKMNANDTQNNITKVDN